MGEVANEEVEVSIIVEVCPRGTLCVAGATARPVCAGNIGKAGIAVEPIITPQDTLVIPVARYVEILITILIKVTRGDAFMLPGRTVCIRMGSRRVGEPIPVAGVDDVGTGIVLIPPSGHVDVE